MESMSLMDILDRNVMNVGIVEDIWGIGESGTREEKMVVLTHTFMRYIKH